jgi:type I restriction enzyme, S subunit
MAAKKVKVSNVPNLRFPEFEGEWMETTLGNLATISSGGTPNRQNTAYWNGSIPWITTSLVNSETIFEAEEHITQLGLQNSSAKLYPKGTVLMAMYGQGKTRGQVAMLGIDACTNQACAAIVTNSNLLVARFLFQDLSKRYIEIRELSNQGGQENLSGSIVRGLNIVVPSLAEQNKIAAFLSVIDQRIQTQSKILQHYKSLIQNLREVIFKQKICFKDPNGNPFSSWETCKLKDITERVVKKNSDNSQNVLTISAQHGLISQLEFFNKSVSAKNVEGYYLLTKGDFAYNKSYSAGYPMGAIKRLNRYNEGIVSTLYICFRFNEKANQDFMEYYFESQIQNIELEKIAQEGARNHGLLNVGVSDFFNIKIKLPSFKEQVEIAKLFSVLNQKVTVESVILKRLNRQKDYLLKNLFI